MLSLLVRTDSEQRKVLIASSRRIDIDASTPSACDFVANRWQLYFLAQQA
ncbi:MAG TPA: hypothetical protein VNA21_14940 [Steroidobacteraceae bacterium]|nr:hypothetical protein [Steroidobacteraceae bacterium]